MNIYQKMMSATSEIGVVAKNLNVSTGSGSYKAVSERDVLDAVKPIEEKYGIYSYPYSRKIIESDLLESVRTYKGQETKTVSKFMRIETVYRFVNAENPEEYIDIISYGDGIDTGDKSTGKCQTYCDKYALMKAYKISTGEDPDQEASEPQGYVKAPKKAQEYKEIKNVAVQPAESLLEEYRRLIDEGRRANIRRYFKVEKDEDLKDSVMKGYIEREKTENVPLDFTEEPKPFY